MEIREVTPPPADSPLRPQSPLPSPSPLRDLTCLPSPDRDGLIVPPPVTPAAKTHGFWVVFAETELQEGDSGFGDGHPVMLERGKNRKGKGEMDDGQEMSYCRRLKRKLIFDELPSLEEEYAGDPEFSRPVPSWKFWHPGDGKWVKRTESTWMYRREKPDLRRVGETFKPRSSIDTPVQARDGEMPVETMQVETRRRSVEGRQSPASSDGRVSLGPSSRSNSPASMAIDDEYGEALRLAEATPLPEMDVEMEDGETREGLEGGNSMEEIGAAPFTDNNGRDPTTYVRVMGSSLTFTVANMVGWIGVGRMQRVRRMWRIVRGYTVDYVLETEDRATAALIVQDAKVDSRFRNNARFLEKEEMHNATRGLDEQLASLPVSRHVALAFPRRRSEEVNTLGVLVRNEERRGLVRDRLDGVEINDRADSVLHLPLLSASASGSTYAPRPWPLPIAPRAMQRPPPPPVPYATRPKITATMEPLALPAASSVPDLLRRMTPLPRVSSLLARLRPPSTSLMKRVEVKLEERICFGSVVKPRHRPHRRTHKRINKLVDVEMEIAPPLFEVFPWTDAEIDFFIDQEEGAPLPDEMYEPYGDFYDTDEE
ncbi:hypothetical protein B0H16DRAFT_1745804 [Mycena metata]|uniref:Uncharacterized protein n=1 Tax=Mycena metata TaxID=1033252 RepID=A0AAD7H0B9_9AGAR|nr:hypothetical protein B0H16DRAFT_1745804 [Mycena metata]